MASEKTMWKIVGSSSGGASIDAGIVGAGTAVYTLNLENNYPKRQERITLHLAGIRMSAGLSAGVSVGGSTESFPTSKGSIYSRIGVLRPEDFGPYAVLQTFSASAVGSAGICNAYFVKSLIPFPSFHSTVKASVTFASTALTASGGFSADGDYCWVTVTGADLKYFDPKLGTHCKAQHPDLPCDAAPGGTGRGLDTIDIRTQLPKTAQKPPRRPTH